MLDNFPPMVKRFKHLLLQKSGLTKLNRSLKFGEPKRASMGTNVTIPEELAQSLAP